MCRSWHRFPVAAEVALYPADDTVSKHYRYLNLFARECFRRSVYRGEAVGRGGATSGIGTAGRFEGFTLLFEALMLMLACTMPLAAVARLVVGRSGVR